MMIISIISMNVVLPDADVIEDESVSSTTNFVEGFI